LFTNNIKNSSNKLNVLSILSTILSFLNFKSTTFSKLFFDFKDSTFFNSIIFNKFFDTRYVSKENIIPKSRFGVAKIFEASIALKLIRRLFCFIVRNYIIKAI